MSERFPWSFGELVALELSQDLRKVDINCPQRFHCCLMFFGYIILLKLTPLSSSFHYFRTHHQAASLLPICTTSNLLISYFRSITSIARSLCGSFFFFFFLLNEMATCQCFGAVSNTNARLNILASSSSVLWLFENIWLDAICSWWFIYVLFVNLF